MDSDWDGDPGEGTSDGRVKRRQQKPTEMQNDIKEEIVIKDEPDDIAVVPTQKSTIEANVVIKSESESENELDLEIDDNLLEEDIKCEDKCKKEKLDSKEDENVADHRDADNPNTHKLDAKKSVKTAVNKVRNGQGEVFRREKNKKASKKLSEKGQQRKMHKCHFCNYEASRKGHLTNHIRTHTGERPFKCEVCPKSFTQKSHLQEHQKIHGVQLPFHCLKCKRGFANEIGKIEHENKCNRRQFECHLCKYFTHVFSNMKKHMQSQHIGEKLFKCVVCSEAFVTKSELVKHARKHTEELPHDCSKCGQRFLNESIKQLHEQRCGGRRFECYACRYKCHLKCNLKTHMQHKHTGDKQFQCSICEMKFVMKTDLNKHLATHAKKRPIRCLKCLRKFTQNDEKEQHEEHCMRRHYQCFMCGFTMQWRSSLKEHIRAHHTGEKPFQCEECDSRFSRKDQLNKHMRCKHIAKK